MAGMLNIGLTGLNAAQLHLNTTSHNIANAATPSYSRQTVVQSTNDPLFTGVGFFGQGTRIDTVKRQYSEYLQNNMLSADNRRAEYSVYSAQISQINNLLADSSAGLSPALQDFFAGVQEVAANPTSVPARQALLSAGQSFVARFQAMDTRLTEISSGVESQIVTSVDSINGLATQVAEMNQRIVIAQAAGPTVPANDLLDQRDALIADLNKLIKTSTVVERDGQMSVFVGSGQSLVIGQSVAKLGVVSTPDDLERGSIAMIAPNGVAINLPENLLTGGELGGLLAFRRETLDASRDQLNRIARQFSDTFNEQHRKGVTLEGVLGGDFFKLDMVTSDGGDLALAPGVAITNDSLLTNDRYRLTYDGAGGYSFTRVSDNEPVDPADIGLDITVPTGAVTGSYFVVPLRNAARDISIALREPRDVAVGNPVSVSSPLSNGGNAKIENIVLESVEGMAAGPSGHFGEFRIRFDGSGFAVESFDGTNWVGAADPVISPTTYDPSGADRSGKSFTVTHSAGWSFTFTASGTPASNDVFVFSPTQQGVADNRNAVALGALQTTKTMLTDSSGSSTATFQSAYSQLVAQAGSKGREVQVGMQVQETLLRQATDARDALSGVNLDEEAANLLRYQQAYQAAGRIMSIAQRLFDEIVSLGR